MATVDSAGSDGYSALRLRVQNLKQQHSEAVQQQNIHRGAEVSTIVSRCAQLEALNSALTADNERLQQQLRQNTERSAKLRRQHEREEQKLRDQIEKLSTASASADGDWAAKLAASEAAAAVRLQRLEQEFDSLKKQHDAELANLRQDHKTSLQDVDEWCRGEIEAVQHNARSQVAQAHKAVEQWQQKYDEMTDGYMKLKQVHEGVVRDLEQSQATLQSREDELQQANTALMRLHKQRADEQAAAEEEMRALKQQHAEQIEAKSAQHAQQLAHIEERLQTVVAKKDATILALRAELKNMYSTLQTLKNV